MDSGDNNDVMGVTVAGVLKAKKPVLGRNVILEGSKDSLSEISTQVEGQLEGDMLQPKKC